MESNFSFLDDIINESSKEVKQEKVEYESPLSSAEIDKLRQEEAVDTLKKNMTTEEKEEFVEAEKSFSKMDMSTIQWSAVEKNKQYNCVIVSRQLMGQDNMPLLYHKKLQTETIEIAKENNGHLTRADKGMTDYLKVNNLKDSLVILVHRAKSIKQISEQQRRDRITQADKEKVPQFVSIQYSNRAMKHFKVPDEFHKLNEELNTFQSQPGEPISVFEDNKFVVFPSKYIFGTGNLEIINAVGIIERECNKLRAKEGKTPIGANKYFVCNQDEPYAQELLKIILRGEDNKLHNQQKTKE